MARMLRLRLAVASLLPAALVYLAMMSVAQAQPSESGRWAFVPPKDAFDAKSMLDLRSLNERVAGENGFVTRNAEGDFVRGDGKPIRFWAIGSGAYGGNRFGKPDLARHARFLAKRGVNMVRFHGNVTGREPRGFNSRERDNLWRVVATMKKEGIYVTFSPYWAAAASFKGAVGGNAHAMLFFDDELQEAYKGWMRQVLTSVNPHTGIPLAKDPALAIIQIQNEDSMLFWTTQALKGEPLRKLRVKYAQWLTKKYGSLDKALSAWNGTKLEDDNFAGGEAGIYILWELTQNRGPEGQKARTADQMQFFTELMYDFNKEIGRFLREDLGCKQLVNAGNWRTADQVKMLDAERWSYSANEVMAVNRYYTGLHIGPNNGWAIVNGDQFTDDSVLLRPRHLPVNLKQVAGYPMLIPESSWVPPLGYQSEGPFLIAAYQSLNGVDTYYWFATGEEDWRKPSSANTYLPSLGKWVCATPMLMGQFPAAALMFRKGYVQRAEPAVLERRALQDLWGRKTPIIAEDPGFDPNRDKGNIAVESNIADGVDPLAFLVGPVVVEYDADPSTSKVVDLGKYIDTGAKTVTSLTGELRLDHSRGVCVLDAPKAQGVTGFLKKAGGSFEMKDVTIRSGNDYVTVLAVSMDGQDLGNSRQVLVQVGTVSRSTGWRTKPVTIKTGEGASATSRQGEEIVNFGKDPWQIVNGDVNVTIRNRSLTTAHVLDVNGMPVDRIPLKRTGAGASFQFPPNAMYVVLK
jgi:hypothetical protein